MKGTVVCCLAVVSFVWGVSVSSAAEEGEQPFVPIPVAVVTTNAMSDGDTNAIARLRATIADEWKLPSPEENDVRTVVLAILSRRCTQTNVVALLGQPGMTERFVNLRKETEQWCWYSIGLSRVVQFVFDVDGKARAALGTIGAHEIFRVRADTNGVLTVFDEPHGGMPLE